MASESDRKDVKYTGLGTQEKDLRTWHHNTQDITSTPYSKKKQVFATFCATLGCLLNGAVIGYTSPAIPSLVNNGTSIWGRETSVDYQQASWITGLLSIGCFVGCVMAGPIMERIGRRRTLMFVASGFYAGGFLLITLASTAELIYSGRFMNGVGLGFVLATVSVYIVEIATTDMRGFLGCFVQFLGSVGVLLTFCIGAVLNWWQLALVHLAMVVPFVIAMWFIPESPRWLIMKGNEWAAEESLKWLRGRGTEALDREIEKIKKEIAIRKRERNSITLLLDPQVFKPFAICMSMMFFLQMSGFNVMVFYCVTIFESVGSSINPNVASIIVGVVLLISCFVALGVVSQLGRKVILVLSIFGMSVCHMTLGTCFYLKETDLLAQLEVSSNSSLVTPVNQYTSILGWLPLVSVIGFLFLGNIGYGTLIWVVTAELLPPRVRAMANSFIICFAFITGFIVAKTFVDLIQSPLKESGTFWLYGGICFIGGIFTFIFVPETRNKSIEEIQDYFRPKKQVKSDPLEAGHPLESVT
eukprot:GFUD01031537.1.p1 GENE.GFUD01031537.1~~GFUD01031537.1.p1  ORF type:complete len:528 (-),score=96.95 GFUD01031537.1:115-1698(-)